MVNYMSNNTKWLPKVELVTVLLVICTVVLYSQCPLFVQKHLNSWSATGLRLRTDVLTKLAPLFKQCYIATVRSAGRSHVSVVLAGISHHFHHHCNSSFSNASVVMWQHILSTSRTFCSCVSLGNLTVAYLPVIN